MGTPTSAFVKALTREIQQTVDEEVAFTIQVAVCAAAKMPRTEIARCLGSDELSVRMAFKRLAKVAEGWT